jgi:formaldehyde-activating enzyme involved in methanogenesis
VAVWVSPQAADPELVFGNNAQATLDALRVGSRQQPTVAELLAERATPFNPFFRAPRS